MKSNRSKKFDHVTEESVYAAVKEFNRIGRKAMLKKYNSGKSRRWYIHLNYDQKVIVRAAHKLGGGKQRLGKFNADEAQKCLEDLEFTVDEKSVSISKADLPHGDGGG